MVITVKDSRSTAGAKSRSTPFESLATFGIVAALLYFGAGIIVPLVLAVLLAFALTPLVTWLRRFLRFPDAVAVLFAVALAILLLVGLAALAGSQLLRLAQDLPGYQETITSKIKALQQQFGGGLLFDRLETITSDLGAQLEAGASTVGSAPIPVVISNDAGPLGLLTSLLGSVIGPIATAAIVTIFLIFLLLGRADLFERFVRLVGSNNFSATNIAIADASNRVGRYLLVQLAINCAYGAVFGTSLWLIGVPSAPLWGVMMVVFRYIPFIGALMLALVPFTLAFAVDPGWNMLLMSVALYFVLDLTVANVVEPRLYGSSTGVSPLAILLTAMFWATIWGPIGLILATPMTVCLVVVGRHLPRLNFLDTLLGSQPVLTPPQQLYQRMIKGDADGAIESYEARSSDEQPSAYVQEVLLPALQIANDELTNRPQAIEQRVALVQVFDVLLDELGLERAESPASNVLLVGGQTELDHCAAQLLGVLFGEAGIGAKVLPPLAVSPEAIDRLEIRDKDVVVLVYLGSTLSAHARYVSRRLKRLKADIAVNVCVLAEDAAEARAEKLHVDAISKSLSEAVQEVRTTKSATAQPMSTIGSGTPSTDLAAALKRELEALATRFAVPVATINLLDDEHHKKDEESFALTRQVVEARQPVIIHAGDATAERPLNLFLQSNGIAFYAAVPIRLPSGEAIGALVLLDYKDRPFDSDAVRELAVAASHLDFDQFALRQSQKWI